MATAVHSAPRRTGWRATTAGELLAEGLGTFILICFGDGVVAMAVAALNQSGRGTKISTRAATGSSSGGAGASRSRSPSTSRAG